tara:strand:+ start:475 stop:642 length:168 start_codon:yes stop_codon:yes gene_type:complete
MPRTKGKQSSRKKPTTVKPKRKYTRRKKVERRQEENSFLRAVINGFKKFLESPFK